MKKRQISKLDRPIRSFEKGEGWQTVKSKESEAAIHRAMDHPVRRKILELLDEGPVRQIDLTRMIGKETQRRYDAAAIFHHLRILENADLVGHEDFSGGKTKIKIIFRKMDVRLQTYRRPDVELSTGRDQS